ncbi:ABC transporter permease [Neobacillus drentensis]|uniref:ABC transporter permease n=1 Tax=Neobacillus drentensis TaxID=220684 RepID=UPI0030007E13
MAEKIVKVNVEPIKANLDQINVRNLDSRIIVKNKAAFLEKNIPNYFSIAGVLGLLLLWQIVSKSGFVNEFTLPAPTTVLSTAGELISSGSLWPEISASLYRIGIGYAVGCILGIVIGIVLGFSKLGEKIGMPIINILYPIPKIAILPLIMLWLGIGEISKITVISLAVFFPIIYNTYTGVSQTNRLLLNVAITFGATKFDLIRKVIFPSALPMIFAGMRISAGVSLLILVSAEMIAAQHGIGSFILKNADLLVISKVLVGVLVLCIIGGLFNYFLAKLEDKLVHWKS